MNRNYRQCPYCKNTIPINMIICPVCGAGLPAVQPGWQKPAKQNSGYGMKIILGAIVVGIVSGLCYGGWLFFGKNRSESTSNKTSEVVMPETRKKHQPIEVEKSEPASASQQPNPSNVGNQSTDMPPSPQYRGDDELHYWQVKAQAGKANARYAAAWRMVPQPLRNNLQHAISYMPKQVDQKCKNHSYGFAQGFSRKAAYLDCSLKHENMLSDGIEQFADAYRRNANASFFDYVNTQAIIAERNW